ncbi:mandelate racemase/muconate lactonizing enzyme family protein [Gulosibacter chungangensis]|uniref:Mandelate racemase/muconate lactonizing enzyme family protein n=1 Tax=Gulosibacter chungangensis TaxID=979746 RepID=A0A7J5B7R4_9MICO|nr:mandelate racemase/muconate lactonizing enzyme family protein [Gulosibacter chungangensis]KAB1640994.1 mandelate racemase/muconate lactonizing enzyme family protein [Gulosibacter chungangensis]
MAKIAEMTTWWSRVPLDNPIKFKWNTITHRDCVVVRLTTDEGVTGHAIGLNRNAPLDVVAQDMLSWNVLGFDAMDVDGFQSRSRGAHAFLDQTGMLAQARSLIDLAMWDIRGKVLGAPLWQLLGGGPKSAAVLLVEGYELPNESNQEFANRLLARASEGYRAIKLEAAGYKDPSQLFERLRLIREGQTGNLDLVVDVNGSWHDLRNAQWMARHLAEFEIAWLEDPFPHHRLDLLRPLTESSPVPIGSGDDVTDPQALIDLVQQRAVDVLRVDATTLGGIQPTQDVIGSARQMGIPVSGHAHPYVHQHFSYATDAMPFVEAFPEDRPFETSFRLTTGSVFRDVKDGLLDRPTTPGLSFDLDLDRVEEWSARKETKYAK